MLRVKDENGNVINGLVKDNLGNIIVNNDKEYNRYIQEKNMQQSVNQLEHEVKELKSMITDLISALQQ